MPRTPSHMDKFANSINPEACLSVEMMKKQQNISKTLFKDRIWYVFEYCARWMYEVGIHFNAIDYDSFKLFVKAVG